LPSFFDYKTRSLAAAAAAFIFAATIKIEISCDDFFTHIKLLIKETHIWLQDVWAQIFGKQENFPFCSPKTNLPRLNGLTFHR
jgi:hypothetical protein